MTHSLSLPLPKGAQAEDRYDDKADASDDARGRRTNEGIRRSNEEHGRRRDTTVHSTVSEHGWQTAFRTQGKPAEQTAQGYTETAHRQDAKHGPARIIEPVVMTEHSDGRMPQSPDDAAYYHRKRDAALLHEVWQQVTAPTPFFAEARYAVEQRRHENERQLSVTEHTDLGCV